jgi:hypothetical protein
VPGSPFNHAQIFDTAIKERKLDLAWRSAVSMEAVSLERALALVLLLGAEADDRNEGSARRFLIRFLDEIGPTLQQVMKVADALDCFRTRRGPPALRDGAQEALEDLQQQLRDRRS